MDIITTAISEWATSGQNAKCVNESSAGVNLLTTPFSFNDFLSILPAQVICTIAKYANATKWLSWGGNWVHWKFSNARIDVSHEDVKKKLKHLSSWKIDRSLYNNNWDFIIRAVSLHLYREICLSFLKTINHFFMHRHTIINCDCYRYRAPLNGQDFLLLWKTCFFCSLARALTNDDWGKK
jgi:hypothetical protein